MSTTELIQSDITTHAGAEFFCQEMNRRGLPSQFSEPRLLVAGCGRGHEAEAIGRHFDTQVDAIDVEMEIEAGLSSKISFQEASVCDMPFEDGTFDAVFYHHVIEHVDQPAKSLTEIHRVMKEDAWLFIGTPNRHRLVSSAGAHRQTNWEPTLTNKVNDNVCMWRDRFVGRFRNEQGAHAGFAINELDHMLDPLFPNRVWLTSEYLQYKYTNGLLRSLINIATLDPFCWFAAPSIYVMCRK